ncbi:MAG: hypothetical protein K2M20_08135 [Lachnospiraceae bacterium]|nr:hypothetical protein [Lachnospiraceae bacterium]
MKKTWVETIRTGNIRTPLTWVAVIVFILSLFPILALSGVDRASGDDWSFGLLTHLAWVDTRSLWQVLRAAFASVKKYYFSWQGTWFSVFLFSLQPEVFSHDAYWIVPVLMTGLLTGGVSDFLYCLLVRLLHISKQDFLLLDAILLLVLIQFVPYQTSAIFWYNGAAHYTVPFALVMFAGARFVRYALDFRKRDLALASLWMTLLGGTNYLTAIFGFGLFFLLTVLFFRRDRRVLFMLIPMALETAGLLVSALAPGNAVRGGSEYRITAAGMLWAVVKALAQGMKGMWESFWSYPVAVAAVLVMAVFLWDILREKVSGLQLHFPCPGLVILCLWGIYCAVYWPVLFVGGSVSDGSVSVGVPNTIFWVFIFALSGSFLYGLGWICEKSGGGGAALRLPVYAVGFAAAFLILGVCRMDLKNSTDYVCYYYIRTGRAAVYKEQMEELTGILTDESVEDAVVPFIVGEQEPLVHLPITFDQDEWTNQKMALFFGKKSLVAIPRDEWEARREIR